MFIFTYPTWWDYNIIQTTYHPSFKNKSHKDRSISKSVQKATKITRNNQLIHKKTRRVSTSYTIWRCFVHISWCFFVPDFFSSNKIQETPELPGKSLDSLGAFWCVKSINLKHPSRWKIRRYRTLNMCEGYCGNSEQAMVYRVEKKAVHGGNVAFFCWPKLTGLLLHSSWKVGETSLPQNNGWQ